MILLVAALAFSAPQESFDEGVKALRTEAYEQAEGAFLDALRQGGSDANVYHGLGNSLYRQGKTGEAAAAWQRGISIDPNHPDLAYNLDQFRGEQGDEYVAFPIPQINDRHLWVATSVLLGFALCVCIGWRNRRVLWGTSAALVVVLWTVDALWAPSHANAVMVLPTVLATSMPEGAGVDLFSLAAGTDLKLLEESSDSYRIELGNGSRGWIPKQSLILSDPNSPFEVQ